MEQALWMKHIPKDISDPIFEEIEAVSYTHLQHQLVLTIHDVKQTEQQTRDNELDAQQTKFPLVAILKMCIRDRCRGLRQGVASDAEEGCL